MGGLNISHPQQINEGLMLNTLERLIRKDREYEGNENNAPNIVRIQLHVRNGTSSQKIRGKGHHMVHCTPMGAHW